MYVKGTRGILKTTKWTQCTQFKIYRYQHIDIIHVSCVWTKLHRRHSELTRIKSLNSACEWQLFFLWDISCFLKVLFEFACLETSWFLTVFSLVFRVTGKSVFFRQVKQVSFYPGVEVSSWDPECCFWHLAQRRLENPSKHLAFAIPVTRNGLTYG